MFILYSVVCFEGVRPPSQSASDVETRNRYLHILQAIQSCSLGDASASEEETIDAALHGRKLTKRAHSYEVNHTHHKRTALEPHTSAHQETGKSSEKIHEVALGKQEWDPKYQYSQEGSAETLDPSGEFVSRRRTILHLLT